MPDRTYHHPVLPFIEITKRGDEGYWVFALGDNADSVAYWQGDTSDADMLASMLDRAERQFFEDRGAVHVLQMKIDEAAERGDLDMLMLLVEGRGYWKGVAAATKHWREELQRPTARPLIEAKSPAGAIARVLGFMANRAAR